MHCATRSGHALRDKEWPCTARLGVAMHCVTRSGHALRDMECRDMTLGGSIRQQSAPPYVLHAIPFCTSLNVMM